MSNYCCVISILFLSGPKLEWDPDVVAGLDEDFDFDNPENMLEDDFVTMANAAGNDQWSVATNV